MSPPRLDVIIPVLDEADQLPELLASLAPLRVAGAEVVLVDGGSRDATLTIAGEQACQCLSAPRGRARQMNAGGEASDGGHLLFLHADTRLPAHAVNFVAKALAGERCWGRFDVRLSGHHPLLSMIAPAMNLRSRLTGIATGDQAMFMTREAFEAVGGFPAQPLMEDIEMSRRLKRLSPPACLRAKVTSSGRRWERNGVWRTIRLMWRLRYRYWRGVSADILAREYRHVR
ncbi:TIGR04283 family arsenosugar biosynthesis glycosyltransferase [Halomonas sp. TRM85114]|uniref:TIGR04283 family arsenosugar biosynthesis glycosyltransferase n=1 Tax=Halomonas jincaotanensis TaxID=2810616 RepID=UPI001BD371F6|nr:TIGR04283 family arsenosugar biosynthesis glycosyltransferase [Halomonas jincaotanensis]MBS9402846.1 TIGR04283 family arsenosugar biosynthesis glycosyltransferase [Halomonas jincaotanensis]